MVGIIKIRIMFFKNGVRAFKAPNLKIACSSASPVHWQNKVFKGQDSGSPCHLGGGNILKGQEYWQRRLFLWTLPVEIL